MKQNQINKSQAGFGLIEIVLVLAIILFLYYFMAKSHLIKPQFDKETQKTVSEQGIDIASYSSIKDSVKNKLKDIQVKHNEELDKIE